MSFIAGATMDDIQKMQIDNLREYLKLYNQIWLLLLTVSVTFFLFSWKFGYLSDRSRSGNSP
jgi:hypothetical protein